MADDDKEMFDSALMDEAPAEVQTEPEQEPAQQPEGQPRDEHGRFASTKPAEEQPAETTGETTDKAAPTPEQSRDDQGIPPWRLREEAEARRAAEARAAQIEQELAQTRHFLAQMQEQNKPKPQVPDLFEDPNAFVDHGVKSAVDPIKSEISQLREFYSQRDAIREHGVEAVKAAYSALDQAAKSGDPEARAVVQRVQQSMHPFGDIVDWHKKQTVISTIGNDPNAWFEKQLEERAKDPKFQAKLMERIRGQAQTRPSVQQLPPSLNKATAALASQGDDDDNSDAGLLKSALRR